MKGGDTRPKNFGGGAEVHVGVDASGAATVLWSGGGIDYGIRSARYVPSSGWTLTKTISFSPTAQTPDLAVSKNGDAMAAWKAQDGVRVTEFTPAGGGPHIGSSRLAACTRASRPTARGKWCWHGRNLVRPIPRLLRRTRCVR